MASLAVCIITKDEEKHLERCLDTLNGIVDEIIIVDTGSADNTKQIAKKYTDYSYEFVWCDDFSAARNFSLSKASKDWILVLDADERIEKNDVIELKKTIQSAKAIAYSFTRRNYANDSSIDGWIADKSSGANGYFPSKLIRLFQNDKNIFFEGVVHETVDASIKKMHGKVEELDTPIHHFAYIDKKSIGKKRGYYFELLKKKVKESPSALSFVELGITARELGNIGLAKDSFMQSLQRDKTFALAYLELGYLLKIEQNYELAKRFYATALKYDPNSAIAYFGLGMCSYYLKELNQAEIFLKKTIELNPKNPQAHTNLAAILEKQGRNEEAMTHAEASIKLDPTNPKAYLNLAVIQGKLGNVASVKQTYQKAVELGHPRSEQIKRKIKSL